jgi:hypothetical protein
MGVSSPRVTVGFTTYNVARYLPLAFDSILAQDYEDFEVVVCDNGSTDATLKICEAYAARDGRFRIFRNPNNLGVSGSFARAVGLARGEFFKYTFHDDLNGPTLLSTCIRALDEAGPDAVLAYPLTMYIDDVGAELGPWKDEVEVRHRAPWRRVAQYAQGWNMCGEVTGVMRSEALRRTHLLRPMLSSDAAMLVELAALGQFVEVPERLYLCRKHANSTYQGDRTPGEVLALLEPTAAPSAGKRPSRRVRSHRDGLVSAVVGGLLRLDMPMSTRISCAGVFVGAWSLRNARVHAGRLRRRLTGRAPSAAPWEGPGAPVEADVREG